MFFAIRGIWSLTKTMVGFVNVSVAGTSGGGDDEGGGDWGFGGGIGKVGSSCSIFGGTVNCVFFDPVKHKVWSFRKPFFVT